MASTHSVTTIQASTSNAAGSSKTSSTVDNTTSYGAVIFGTMTNGGTGPTLPCAAIIDLSNDNSTWAQGMLQTTGSTTASDVTPFYFDLPPTFKYARLRFIGNTGQAVTVVGYSSLLATI